MSTPAFPYRGPPESLPAIDAALRRVVDPEVAMNIVDVGLVVDVCLHEGTLHVQVTMTSAACPVADVVVADVRHELEHALPDGPRVQVELVWHPEWTPERMSASARRFMGW